MSKSNNRMTVTNVTAAELRDTIQSHGEAEFVLIDVRQAEEYASGHLPGARLIPLGELKEHAEELEALSGRRIVFYCRSGARSATASAWATQALHLPRVYNLLGGFVSWAGLGWVDTPRREAQNLGNAGLRR